MARAEFLTGWVPKQVTEDLSVVRFDIEIVERGDRKEEAYGQWPKCVLRKALGMPSDRAPPFLPFTEQLACPL